MQITPSMSLLGLDTITGIISLFWSVATGATYFVSRSAKENFDLFGKFKIKSIETSPARLKDLLEVADGMPSSGLQQVLVVGSLMTEAQAEDCERILGVTPSYLYGSSEVGAATVGTFDNQANNRLGKLVADVEFEIVDEKLEPLAIGQHGHIRYRKPGMPAEYWKSASTHLNGFVDGWFYPGDQGWLNEDGYLFLSGRSDDVVNAAGSKFNLLSLDLWLEETNLFDEVATFSYLSQGENRIGLAFVSKRPPNPELLVEKLQAFLPNLQLGEILRLSSLPRNKMDKVDRKALAELAEESNA